MSYPTLDFNLSFVKTMVLTAVTHSFERLSNVDRLQSLGTQEQERQAAISKLKSLESEFVEVMQAGMERFSRPLRQYIISPSEHATLFQNVEKVSDFLSELNLAVFPKWDGLDVSVGSLQ